MIIYSVTGAIIAAVVWSAAPAHAEVVELRDDFFVVRHSASVPVSREDAWSALISPSEWWDESHSFSGDADNFSLDARAGGCFCEALPPVGDRFAAGSVRHLDVVLVDPGRTLRLVGGLGPLQGEPLHGVLTITFEPVGAKTQIQFEYVVGGPSRLDIAAIAPAVDAVIAGQLSNLAATLQSGTSGMPGQAARSDDQPPLARGRGPASSIQTVEPDELMPAISEQVRQQTRENASGSIGEDFLRDDD